jgi:hypothetical protein
VFHLVAGVSLVLCLATTAVWIRSYWVWDLVAVSRQRSWELTLNCGEFDFSVKTRYAPAGPVSAATPFALPPRKATPFSAEWTFLHTSAPASHWFVSPDKLGFGRMRIPDSITPFSPPSAMSSWNDGVRWFFPAWIVVAITGFMTSYRMRVAHNNRRARKRTENGLCLRCGYDLRATPERCPECGKAAVVNER